MFLICKWYYLIFLEDKGKKTLCPIFHSLHHRHNLIQADYVFEAVSRSLFWRPYKVKMNYRESVLNLPLNWLAKWTMVFLTIMVHTQILANSLGPRTLFWRLLTDGINQRSSFICGICYISQLHTELTLKGRGPGV